MNAKKPSNRRESPRNGLAGDCLRGTLSPAVARAQPRKSDPRALTRTLLGIPKLMIGKSPHQFHGALPNTRALDDGYVAIDGEIREGLDAATRLWPANFQPIDFGSCADAQDFSGVV